MRDLARDLRHESTYRVRVSFFIQIHLENVLNLVNSHVLVEYIVIYLHHACTH